MKRYLSLGAGVQSSTLAMMIATGELPPIEAAIFADTQAEPQGVYDWLEVLKGLVAQSPHPFPIHTVTAGNLEGEQTRLRTSGKTGNKYVRTLIPAFVAMPNGKKALLGRKCTAEFKIRAILRKQRELTPVPRGCKTIVCTALIGISTDEAHRMKPSREPWSVNAWPLIEVGMSRQDCLAWMASHGYPTPPRSSCVFCPFHSDAEWTRLRDEEPAEFARAIKFDNTLREQARKQTGTAASPGDVFLHSSLVPLAEVQFKDVPSHAQVDLFGNECEGLCGV